jgi:hypothetical protein
MTSDRNQMAAPAAKDLLDGCFEFRTVRQREAA